ncbi:hypothetical protein CC1G_04856 [Coprinopsis cinerea okayama7|uniref:Uncharacterized protein n=1 Tax=Coprinopsis cinerea (strain Okayama-7 / 130 / ATCC MYA-4618 / FGSC 9003) TaxID=240176 RepID=A8PFT9_COPC7|nr:hypothetical protein CC1G_04856 [Coprinopsis cinerea okayama7\|eukprot:XP_001841012.1 hypothetical protein CC1G_04856 [Coprinopsis cinerea okayama7\
MPILPPISVPKAGLKDTNRSLPKPSDAVKCKRSSPNIRAPNENLPPSPTKPLGKKKRRHNRSESNQAVPPLGQNQPHSARDAIPANTRATTNPKATHTANPKATAPLVSKNSSSPKESSSSLVKKGSAADVQATRRDATTRSAVTPASKAHTSVSPPMASKQPQDESSTKAAIDDLKDVELEKKWIDTFLNPDSPYPSLPWEFANVGFNLSQPVQRGKNIGFGIEHAKDVIGTADGVKVSLDPKAKTGHKPLEAVIGIGPYDYAAETGKSAVTITFILDKKMGVPIRHLLEKKPIDDGEDLAFELGGACPLIRVAYNVPFVKEVDVLPGKPLLCCSIASLDDSEARTPNILNPMLESITRQELAHKLGRELFNLYSSVQRKGVDPEPSEPQSRTYAQEKWPAARDLDLDKIRLITLQQKPKDPSFVDSLSVWYPRVTYDL